MAIRTPAEIWSCLSQTVKTNNGILNSQFSSYKNQNTKVSITCLACNTNWQPAISKIIHSHQWCPHCAIKKSSNTRKQKNNVWGRFLENIKNKNIELNGHQTYINHKHKVKLWCKKCNHKWDTSIASVLNCNSDCPQCSQKSLTINQHLKWQPILKDKLLNLMKTKNGTLLSEIINIINTKEKVLIKCNACNKTWEPSIGKLLHSHHWCPRCGTKKSGSTRKQKYNVWGRFLENIKNKNIELNGHQTYLNSHQKVNLSCKTCNHKWETSISSVLNNNSACPECHRTNVSAKQYLKWRPITYQKLLDLMVAKNGTLLSKIEDFKSVKDRVSVKCDICNTQWSDTVSHLLSGNRWCSSCASIGKSEFMMKNIIEICLEKTFIKTRSEKWNTNPYTKRPLELDCYNEELKIAIEYDGQQHYRHNHWHQDSWKNFVNVNKRDFIKSNNCYKQGVILYRIQEPEKNHMRLLNDFPSFFRYIHSSLESQGLLLPVSIEKLSKLKSIHHLIITNKLKSPTTFSHKTS